MACLTLLLLQTYPTPFLTAVVVVLTLTHRYNAVRGRRTGFTVGMRGSMVVRLRPCMT